MTSPDRPPKRSGAAAEERCAEVALASRTHASALAWGGSSEPCRRDYEGVIETTLIDGAELLDEHAGQVDHRARAGSAARVAASGQHVLG